MRRLDAYIRNSVVLSMLVVLALTSSLDFIFTLADELGSNTDGYGSAQALLYTLRVMPTGIYEMLPFTALGGALIGLGILASHNELVVIQAAGISPWRIVWAIMKPTMAVMLLSLWLGEYVAPPLQQRAQSDKAIIESGGEALSSAGGDWRKIGNEFIHINAILPGGTELRGVTRYVLDDSRRMLSSSFASGGSYQQDDEGPYWRLSGLQETYFANGEISVSYHEIYDWRIDLSPELLSVLLVDPERQSISGLYRFAEYFENEGLESSSYYLAFWKKLLQPLATASLVLLAISFVFGPLRSSTMGFRVFVAIAIGLTFTILQRMLGPTSLLYGFNPMLAVMVPILICALLGILLLRRV
jgi:lipopolysaccharide export system permease protein